MGSNAILLQVIFIQRSLSGFTTVNHGELEMFLCVLLMASVISTIFLFFCALCCGIVIHKGVNTRAFMNEVARLWTFMVSFCYIFLVIVSVDTFKWKVMTWCYNKTTCISMVCKMY